MSGVVVHYQPELLVGIGAGQVLEDRQELLVTMTWLADAGDFAGHDLQGREQRRVAMSHIIMGLALGHSDLHRQGGRGTVQSLDLGFLIDAQDDRVLGLSRPGVTQQVAFGAGPELSPTAQSVARTLISGRWPSEAEWSALRSEYDWARLMAGSQRPGLIGVEEPTQLLNYQTDFTICRRLETLVCWEDTTPADIVYTARAAGVVLPLTTAV